MIVDGLIQATLLIGAVFLCVLAALQTAGVYVPVWQIVVASSLLLLVVVKYGYFRLRLNRDSVVLGSRLGWFYSLLLLLQFAYYLNPSHAWVAGSGLVPVDHLSWLPASVDREGCFDSLLFACAGMAVLASATLLNRTCVIAMMHACVVAGIAMSVMVIMQRLEDIPFPVYPVTGIFVSENHYAAFANFNIALLLALGSRGIVSAAYYLPFTLLVGTSIVLSGSRAGLLIMLMSLVVFCVYLLIIRLKNRTSADVLRIAAKYLGAAIIVAVFSMVLFAVVSRPQMLSGLSGELSYRASTIRDTLSMWLDQPWWGTGPGSFARVFPYYQSAETSDRFFDHAHCDPVQLLAEYGVLGVTLIAVLLFRLASGRGPQLGSAFGDNVVVCGWFLALAGCAVHSLVDFTFRQELIALMCLAGLGIIIRSGYDAIKAGDMRAG